MPVNPESHLAGFEIFAKFSAWIKAKFDSPNYESKSRVFLLFIKKIISFFDTGTVNFNSEIIFFNFNLKKRIQLYLFQFIII